MQTCYRFRSTLRVLAALGAVSAAASLAPGQVAAPKPGAGPSTGAARPPIVPNDQAIPAGEPADLAGPGQGILIPRPGGPGPRDVHNGVLSGPPDNTVNYVFADTQIASSLRISGGAINVDQVIGPVTPVAHDWTFTVDSINLDNGAVNDEITVTVTLWHTSIPHPPQDGGFGVAETVTLTANADNAVGGVLTVNGPFVCRQHGQHFDNFDSASLTINVTSNGPIDDITSWVFTWSAFHCQSCFAGCGSFFNDACAAAMPVGEGATSFDNRAATLDGPSPCGIMGSDVWFLYTPSSTGIATATTCEDGILNVDTVIAAYNAPCPPGPALACNDDGPPFCPVVGSFFSGSTITFGVTAGSQYLIQVGGYNGATGHGDLTIALAGACGSCPPGGITETEPDCGLPADTVNGGCNSTPPVFSPIALGDTVCGTAAFDGAFRDTDWYRFTLTGTTAVTWTANAEFDLLIGFLAQPCPQNAFLSFNQAAACAGPTSLTQTLNAGTYVAFIAPQFTSLVGCGSRYSATLTGAPVGACCTGSGCTTTTRAACATQNGAYRGDGTNCTAFSYAASPCTSAFEDISATGAPGCVGDDCSTSVPIGFTFTFLDSPFTSVRVGSNGYLTFGPNGNVFGNAPIPSTIEPNNLVAPLWDDWRSDVCAGGAQIDTQTLGVAPNRRFIAQWTSVCHFNDNAQRATFQAILFETSNTIEYRYNVWALNSPSVGVENADGTIGASIDPATIAQVDCRRLLVAQTGMVPCACPCDWNFDNALNSQDFFDLLTSLFSGNADYNHDGVTNSQDFFDFLTCFFNGCPPQVFITGVNPASGHQNNTITVFGRGFDINPVNSCIFLGGHRARAGVVQAFPDHLVCVIGPGLEVGAGPITLVHGVGSLAGQGTHGNLNYNLRRLVANTEVNSNVNFAVNLASPGVDRVNANATVTLTGNWAAGSPVILDIHLHVPSGDWIEITGTVTPLQAGTGAQCAADIAAIISLLYGGQGVNATANGATITITHNPGGITDAFGGIQH